MPNRVAGSRSSQTSIKMNDGFSLIGFFHFFHDRHHHFAGNAFFGSQIDHGDHSLGRDFLWARAACAGKMMPIRKIKRWELRERLKKKK